MSGMGGLASKRGAEKLLLIVISGCKVTTATFSKCGDILRYSLIKVNLDNPQPIWNTPEGSETKWKWVFTDISKCLRYSPSLRENLKVERLQLDCFQSICFCIGDFLSYLSYFDSLDTLRSIKSKN
jgi:hypothetical protein